tara:strand:+ start:199 stop:432 length:234 start_codon:yes stop_codon:yes gene_type:complete
MTKTFPAPTFLIDDPWFDPPFFSETQYKTMLSQLEEENILLHENQSSEKVDNIHEIMYNLSTQWKKQFGNGSEKIWQ